MGGVSSCGDSPSPQLGAQNQVFSQVVQWKNVPLSPSSRSSSLRLINPFSAGGWAGWEPLPLCSWDFVCEVFLLNCAGIPSWTEWARDTLALCWCQQRSEQRLCHHKSWWLHCGVASSGFGLVWREIKYFQTLKTPCERLGNLVFCWCFWLKRCRIICFTQDAAVQHCH